MSCSSAGSIPGGEIRFCQSQKHAIEHFAAHWAAKEAIFRALGTNWSRGVAWTDLEVRDSRKGRPVVRVGGPAKALAVRLGIADIHVTMAHCRTYATATALALSRAPAELGEGPSLEMDPGPSATPDA